MADISFPESLIKKFGEDAITEMKTELQNNGSTATFTLLNSVKFEYRQEVEKILINFLSEDYGKYIHQGRQTGKMPPISKIKEWTRVKGIPEQAAFPIAKNIWKFGIAPKPFLFAGFESAKQGLIIALIQHYQKAIFAEIKEAFKQ